MQILDISEYQGNISWETVKEEGYTDIIIRAGYGRNNLDGYFYPNMNMTQYLGFKVGLYWFSYAYTVDMARKEAEYLCALADKFVITLPLFWDFEYDSVAYAEKHGVTVTKELLQDMLEAFNEVVTEYGYMPGVYSNYDYEQRFGLLSKGEELGMYLWYAQYSNSMYSLPMEPHIWQYTSTGKVNGINGNVDMNRALRPIYYLNMPVYEEQEVKLVWCFYKVDGGDTVYWFNGSEVRPLNNPDQKTILERIYEDCTGYEIPVYNFKSTAPWHKRLIQACTISPLTAEDGKIGG